MPIRERESKFELLRIVSMILIIASHYSLHGGLLESDVTLNYIVASLLNVGGKLGVTCFVLITGYFMVDKSFKLSNVLRIAMQTLFYALIALFILFLFNRDININIAINTLLSPINGLYWFVTAYIGMYILSPFLNIVARKINNNYGLLIFLGFFISIVPFIFVSSHFMVDNIRWFCFIYLIGAYLKHTDMPVLLQKRAEITFWLMIMIMWGSSLVLYFFHEKYNMTWDLDKANYFHKMNSPTILIAGIALFLIFSKKNFRNKTVNFIAGSTFACYLLHDNTYTKDIIWKNIFNIDRVLNKSIIIVIPHLLLCIVTIFIAAISIEFIRKKIEKILLKNKMVEKTDARIEALFKDFYID